MTVFISLADAIADHTCDGDVAAIGGFKRLIPHAAGHDVILRGGLDLEDGMARAHSGEAGGTRI